MLLIRSRWHDAANRPPLASHAFGGLPIGEARLCRFANGTGGPGEERPGDPTNPPPEGEGEGQTQEGGRTEQQGGRSQQDIAAMEQETHERARGSLERQGGGGNKTERERTVYAVLEKVKNMHDKLNTLHAIMAGVSKEARQHLRGEHWNTWLQTEASIMELLEQAKLMQKTASEIHTWEYGNRSPHELYTFLEEFTQPGRSLQDASQERSAEGREAREALYARENLLNTIQGAILASGGTDTDVTDRSDPWETRNKAAQIAIVRTFNELPVRSGEGAGSIGAYLSSVLEGIDQRATLMEAALQQKIWKREDGTEETMDAYIARVSEALRTLSEEAKRQGRGDVGIVAAFRSMLPGIKLYSVLEIMETVRKVKDAYLEAYKQRSSLKTDILAKQFGALVKILPLGGSDVPQILETQLDTANDKVKDQHVEYLTRRNAGYMELFGPHGELEHNAHDGNRARAVLEYAASRGMLYDIDLDSRDRSGVLTIKAETRTYSLRELVPRDWGDDKIRDYYSTLLTKHNKGKNDERDKYYNRHYTNDKGPRFVELVDQELKDINLWAVHGIIKRSIERGLLGEITPLLLVTLMRNLQEIPTLRRIMTEDWLDRTGGEVGGYYRTAFMLGAALKGEDSKIMKWTKTGDPTRLAHAGVHGRIIEDIRREIRERTGKFQRPEETKKLDSYVAKILAGQTVEIDGKIFTIFKREYAWFRTNEIIQQQGDLHPGVKDEDPDYYSMECENIMSGARPVAQILARTAQGTFAEADKAQHYMGRILGLDEELRAKGLTDEAENFRREIGEKISGSLTEQALGDSRTSGLADLLTKGKKAEVPALKSLTLSGFFDIEPVVQTLWNNDANTGTGLAQKLLRSIDARLLEQLQALMSRSNELRQREARAQTDDERRTIAVERQQINERYRQNMRAWKGKQPAITWPQLYLQRGHAAGTATGTGTTQGRAAA